MRQGPAGWEIELTRGPVRLHPYSLYAMGFLSKDEVPVIRLQAPVSSRSSFIIEGDLQGQPGTYLMEVFLFWPGSGSQFSRAALAPIVID